MAFEKFLQTEPRAAARRVCDRLLYELRYRYCCTLCWRQKASKHTRGACAEVYSQSHEKAKGLGNDTAIDSLCEDAKMHFFYAPGSVRIPRNTSGNVRRGDLL